MTEFAFQEMFPLGEDETPYRKLDAGGVSLGRFEGRDILKVDPAALTTLANDAFVDISFLLRSGHLKQLRAVYDSPDASDNDRYVAYEMLKNANISAGRVLPMCQDTGTAIIMGKKGERVMTGASDEAALSKGVFRAFTENALRYSQMAPLDMYKEVNTKTNLPAQIELYATEGEKYEFLFIAKGGGSANKSFLFQETRALLTPERILKFIEAKAREIGTAACPPYHLAIVIGGTSAEFNLKAVKLASCRYLDALPTKGGPGGHAFRDLEMEQAVLAMSRELGIGAQFGGRYYCHDVRVIRLPRHGASMPIGIGVSCSADRQAKAKITRDGLFLEQLETNPAQYMPDVTEHQLGGECVAIDLNRPMAEVRQTLARHPIRTRLALTGTLVVARDIAHAKLRERLEGGQGLPDYFKNHPVYYAGPAKTPEGYASGSFGPTTAGRMDGYVDQFMAAGGSHVMLAKGNRSRQVTEACKKHGGFYLGSIGGPAARLAQDCIRKVEVLDYPELGMEAVWRIEVENFPAFIVVDDKGNDFFAHVNR